MVKAFFVGIVFFAGLGLARAADAPKSNPMGIEGGFTLNAGGNGQRGEQGNDHVVFYGNENLSKPVTMTWKLCLDNDGAKSVVVYNSNIAGAPTGDQFDVTVGNGKCAARTVSINAAQGVTVINMQQDGQPASADAHGQFSITFKP